MLARVGNFFPMPLLGAVPGSFPGPEAVRSDRMHHRLSRFHVRKWASPVSSRWWQVVKSGRFTAEVYVLVYRRCSKDTIRFRETRRVRNACTS